MSKTMKVRIESSKIVRPSYRGTSPLTTDCVPLTVFDKVTFDAHIAVIYVYHPPTPTNEDFKLGLERVLALYREWAGRLGKNEKGESIILLNDTGVKFVEASVDSRFDQVMPLKPLQDLLNLHPCLKGGEELVQVQVTRFNCGSMVVGFTAHHLVADGHATSNFLVAWGQATRGAKISPLPLQDRSIFTPRQPPIFKFEHKGLEFMSKKLKDAPHSYNLVEDIAVHKAHFTKTFISKLKAKASASNVFDKPYSTFESLLAHLWRAVTKARALVGTETTQIRISVNGRMRLKPPVLNNYFGNLVLWAFPRARVKELICQPLPYAAKLIHDAIARVDNDYFLSFIDYANYRAREEDLIPTADMNKIVLCPNLEVDSWLRFPLYELDFGGGSPYLFMPSFAPAEGMMLLLPSFIRDGSTEVYVSLFKDNLEAFKQICYSID
ncbi:hypothetical protein Ancab_007649 [Ancistrocladus abbreviatus]